MRTTRPIVLVALTAILALSGCSGQQSIDVPVGPDDGDSGVVETSAPAPTAEATVAVPTPSPTTPTVDCASALSPSSIEEQLELPEGFVSLTEGSGPGACSYTIAGNSSAIQIVWTPATDTAESAAAQWAADGGLTPITFGDAAAFRAPDAEEQSANQPASMQALAGGYGLAVFSYVGDQGQIESYARSIYAALGVEVG